MPVEFFILKVLTNWSKLSNIITNEVADQFSVQRTSG